MSVQELQESAGDAASDVGELGSVAIVGNTLLRDLARKLSALRDAAVLVESLDSLKDQLPADFDSGLLAGCATA